MQVYKVEFWFTPQYPEDVDKEILKEDFIQALSWQDCDIIRKPVITQVQTFPKRGKVAKVDK